MSHYTYIYGVRIYTDDVYDEDTDIGLYTVSGENNQIRWSEAPLSGVTDSWLDGMLVEVGDITKRINTSNGGGKSIIGSVTIKFDNTQKVIKGMRDIGLRLGGLKVDIIEFVGTEADSDSSESSVFFTGTLEEISTNELVCTCEVNSSMARRRNQNISTAITDSNGKIIPITFGASDPINGRYFKAITTQDTEDLLTNNDLNPFSETYPYPSQYPYPPQMVLFPVYETLTTENQIKLRVGKQSYLWEPSSLYIGSYIVIKSGPAEIVGTFRKVIATPDHETLQSGPIDTWIEGGVTITLQDYMPDVAKGNLTGTLDPDQTWIAFYTLYKEFKIAVEIIDGFYDSVTKTALDGKVEIYGKSDNDEIVRILDYGCEFTYNNGTFLVNPRIFNDDLSSLKLLHIEPCTSVIPYVSSLTPKTLTNWGVNAGFEQLTYSGSDVEGIFAWSTVDSSGLATVQSLSDCIDRDPDTYLNYQVTMSSEAAQYYAAFKIVLPSIPLGVKFNKIYLLVYAKAKTTVVSGNGIAQSKFIVKYRSYINNLKTCIETENVDYENWVTINNVPDFYYIDPKPETGNEAFYVNNDSATVFSGYTKIEIDVTTKEEYDNIEEMIMMFYTVAYVNGTARSTIDQKQIYEVAVLFENAIDIKDEIYM